MRKVLVFLILFPCLSFALQRLPIDEGASICATVSRKALNCISVEGDRIVGVKGISGEFQMDKDPQIGQIFLQPTIMDKDSSIELFITTELGKTYSLSLTTNDEVAQTIVLVPADCNMANEEALNFEKSNPYEVVLVNIIKAMHAEAPLGGYLRREFNKKLPKVQGAAVLQSFSYLGGQLQGVKLRVNNSSNSEIHLHENDFYSPGIRAISILNKRLCPGDWTAVYLVKDR